MKKKTLLGIVVLCGLLGIGLAGIAMANSAVDGDEPAMMVSPSTIVLANDNVDTVTVHTNIPASTVVDGSLTLDGATPTGIGIDTCGHIVAKFSIADLVGIPESVDEPVEVTLTLSGDLELEDEDGEIVIDSFSATDVVTVK